VILLFAFAYVAVDKFWMSKRIAQEKPVSAHGAEQKAAPCGGSDGNWDACHADRSRCCVRSAATFHRGAAVRQHERAMRSKSISPTASLKSLLNALSRPERLARGGTDLVVSFKGKDVDVSTIAHKLMWGPF